MENKTYTNIKNLSSNSDTTTTTTPTSFVLSPSINTITTSSLQTLQTIPTTQPIGVYSDNNNTNNNNGSNIVITQPIFSKLSSETIKQEQFENQEYSIIKSKLTTNQSKTNTIRPTTGITHLPLNSRETINGLSAISMANISGHLMSTLNPSHLPNGTGAYFVSGLPNDLTSNYKLPASSNSDLPSPSNSSNSSNPSSSNHRHHHPHHQAKCHGESGDPTRKREVRLQKNREAARECRRKKKEYIKCLEERVTGLENQNKALIEELRQLKELYCQREETNNNTNTKTTTTR
jgi:hypothetical protein